MEQCRFGGFDYWWPFLQLGSKGGWGGGGRERHTLPVTALRRRRLLHDGCSHCLPPPYSAQLRIGNSLGAFPPFLWVGVRKVPPPKCNFTYGSACGASAWVPVRGWHARVLR